MSGSSSFFEIPIVPATPQTFTISLGNNQYRFTLQWRELGAQCWFLDIADSNNNQLVAGIPLVTGADLLLQHPEINVPGQLWVVSDGDPAAQPTFSNLGDTAHLYYAAASAPLVANFAPATGPDNVAAILANSIGAYTIGESPIS